jgi:hypothetical protein
MLPIWALTSVQTQSDEDQQDIAVILKTLYPVNYTHNWYQHWTLASEKMHRWKGGGLAGELHHQFLIY